MSSIRLSVGRFTKEEDIQNATQDLIDTAKKLREKSLSYQMQKSSK